MAAVWRATPCRAASTVMVGAGLPGTIWPLVIMSRTSLAICRDTRGSRTALPLALTVGMMWSLAIVPALSSS